MTDAWEVVPMRVLSLSRPWVWSIVELAEPMGKRIENRTWKPPESEIGNRFALHAAQSWDMRAFAHFDLVGLDAERYTPDAAHPSGLILGTAVIDRVIDKARDAPPYQGRWFFGPIGWVLRDVVKLATPIEWKGAQGFRWLPSDVSARIWKQHPPEMIQKP